MKRHHSHKRSLKVVFKQLIYVFSFEKLMKPRSAWRNRTEEDHLLITLRRTYLQRFLENLSNMLQVTKSKHILSHRNEMLEMNQTEGRY